MKIALASDHAGYEEKERLKPLLKELGIQYQDLGIVSESQWTIRTMPSELPKKLPMAASNRDC